MADTPLGRLLELDAPQAQPAPPTAGASLGQPSPLPLAMDYASGLLGPATGTPALEPLRDERAQTPLGKLLGVPEREAPAAETAQGWQLGKLLESGYHALVAGVHATDATASERALATMRKIDAGEKVSQLDDIYGYQSMAPELRQQFRQQLEDVRVSGLARTAQEMRKAGNVQLDPVVAKALAATTPGEFWENFKQKPMQFIATIGAQSIAQSLPNLAGLAIGGLAGGPAGAAMGAFGGSFAVDYAATVLGVLQEKGIDVTDKTALAKAFADKELMADVERQARAHGAAVAALDAASAGIGGRILAPPIRNKFLREVVNIPAQAVAQGTLGAAGEALGEVAAGQPLQFGQIAAEFFGEFATAPVDVATLAVTGGRGAQPQTPLAAVVPEIASDTAIADSLRGQPGPPQTPLAPQPLRPGAQGELFPGAELGTAPPPTSAGPQLELPGISPAGRQAVEEATRADTTAQQLSFDDYIAARNQYELQFNTQQNNENASIGGPVLGGWYVTPIGGALPQTAVNVVDAFDQFAAKPDAVTYQVDLTKLDPTKVSGSLFTLAANTPPNAMISNVTAPNTSLIAEAQELVERVRQLFQFRHTPERFAEAQERYNKRFAELVAQGLRYLPSTKLNDYSSFVYAEPIPQDALVRSEIPAAEPSIQERQRPYTLTSTNNGINVFTRAAGAQRRGTYSITNKALQSILDWSVDPRKAVPAWSDLTYLLNKGDIIIIEPQNARDAARADKLIEQYIAGDTSALAGAFDLGWRMHTASEASLETIFTFGSLPYDQLRIESPRVKPERTTMYNHAPWHDEAKGRLRYNGRAIVPGQIYDYDSHTAGEVLIASSNGDRQKLERWADLATKLLAIFAPGHRLILTSDENIFGLNIAVGAGSYAYLAPGLHNIYLSSARVDDSDVSLLANIFWHEIGHLITFVNWDSTAQGIKEQLLFQFQKQMRSVLWQTAAEFTPGFRPPTFIARRDLKTPGRAIDVLDNGSTQAVWYVFDEYLAEEIARWSSHNQEALSWTEQFIKGITRTLEQVRNWVAARLGIPVTRLDATADTAAWLESIRASHAIGLPTAPQQMYAAGTELTQQANARSEGEAAVPAAPVQGASQMSRSLLRKQQVEAERERRRMLVGLDRYNKIIKHGWNLLQLAAKNRHIAGLQQYVEQIDAWHNFKMGWIVKADEHVKAWNALKAEASAALGEFLFDMANMVYLPTNESPRWPTAEEFIALVRKHKLNAQQLQLYTNVRDHFLAVLAQIERSLTADAARLFGVGTPRHAARLNEIAQAMAALRAQPYFPFSRFGSYVTMVRDAQRNKLYQQHYETRLGQLRDLARVRKAYPGQNVVQTKVAEEIQQLVGMPRIFIESVIDKLQLTPDQRRQVNDIMYELSPAQSFRKHFMQREGLPGYSRDVIRAYANYFFHGANHLARLEYSPLLDAAVKAMETEYRGLERLANVPPLLKRRGIIDFVREHYNYVMAPAVDWASLRSVAFQFYFALNVKQAVVNFTQIPMVGYPFLAAQFGDISATRAIAAAAVHLRNMYRKGAAHLTPDFARALSLGIEQGFIDESQAADLADISESNILRNNMPGLGIDRAIREAARYTTILFRLSEHANRRVMFRAGYVLGHAEPDGKYGKQLQVQYAGQINELLNAGWSKSEAVGFVAGKDSVRSTQYEYARWAKPRFMRGPIKANLFTFMNYLQNTLWFAAYSPGNIRYLVLLLAAAGIMGMPGAGDAGDLAKLIAKLFLGKHFNIEVELAKWLKTLGIERPDMVLHGLSRDSFGMTHVAEALGLPMPSIDLSGSLSMGHIVPGLQKATDAMMGAGEGRDVLGATAQGVAGAAFNIPISIWQALMSDNPDPQKRWEPAMPIALRNVSKATRIWQEQEERSRSGAQVAPFNHGDPQQMMELAMLAVGFQPTRLTEKWETIHFKREAQEYWALRRQLILEHAYYERYIAKNMDGWKEEIERVKAYNKEVPFPELALTNKDIVDSMRQREIRRIKEEYGLVGGRRNYRLGREIEDATHGANPIVHQQPAR